jgi:hypothetical protein
MARFNIGDKVTITWFDNGTTRVGCIVSGLGGTAEGLPTLYICSPDDDNFTYEFVFKDGSWVEHQLAHPTKVSIENEL